jgi:SAM-dependent methyltransferase
MGWLRGVARAVVPRTVRGWLRGLRPERRPLRHSGDYRVLDGEDVPDPVAGWRRDAVAERQRDAFEPLLREMRAGRPRRDFVAAAEALAMTQAENPLILEVGCGHGFYFDVLSHLSGKPLQYVGMDCSEAMIGMARARYPEARFLVGDATRIPFRDAGVDIVLSGTVLMHVPEFGLAIREARRVARDWCVFHTVTVRQRGETVLLSKRAYGEPVVEVVLNEEELRGLFVASGLRVVGELPSIAYNLEAVVGEPTETKTYVCRCETVGP